MNNASHDPNRKRREPGRLPAIILAVLVHAIFIALLVFGVNWQSRAPEPVQAELWSKLPPATTPQPEPQPEPSPPKPEPKPEPPKPTAAEIELKEKQARKEKLEKERREKTEKERKEKIEKERKEEETRKLAQQKAEAEAKKAAEDRARAEAQARQSVIDEWRNRINSLVRSRANVPDSVTGMPEVQVRVRLLVTGSVFDVQVVKVSGNRVYDDAIGRAIAGIRQWPTPTDPTVFRDNRDIILNIKHEK